jgi:S1-C subfamily serine protease
MSMSSPSASPTPLLGLADAVDRVAASVVGLRTRRMGTSTAFAWRPGVLVTAATAVGHASRVQIVNADGEAAAGTVRGLDPATDLAVVAVEMALPVAERRLAPPVRTGDVVFAAGRDADGRVHASFGHVGAVGGAWRTWRGGQLDRLVRLDGGLYPGLMGAPVADAAGQVLGLASAALSRHHGVVVPAATIDRVVDALLAHGRVQRGHLGVVAQSVALSPAMRQAAGVDADAGLLLAGVGDDSPAARAGLLVGDIVVAVGGRPVPTPEALRDLLGAEQIGSRLRLVLLRGGARHELSCEVGEQRWEARC